MPAAASWGWAVEFVVQVLLHVCHLDAVPAVPAAPSAQRNLAYDPLQVAFQEQAAVDTQIQPRNNCFLLAKKNPDTGSLSW